MNIDDKRNYNQNSPSLGIDLHSVVDIDVKNNTSFNK